MINSSPIPSPPPELVQQWRHSWLPSHGEFVDFIATQAARWGADQQLKLDAEQIAQAYQKGADQELEACIEWVSIQLNCTDQEHLVPYLRAARRPKALSLKEQALDELASAERLYPADWSTIRKALEALPN